MTTPSHISISEEGNLFVPNLLHQTHTGIGAGQIFDVLITVVDRISLPLEFVLVSENVTPRDSLRARKIRHGDEGMSAFLADTETVAPELWADQDKPRERQTTPNPQPSTLSFLHRPYKMLLANSSNFRRSYPYTSRTIQLPVANTVFQNGLTGTIKAQRWIFDEHNSKPSLVCTRNVLLPRQTVDLTGTRSDAQSLKNILYSVPAEYITPSRVVTAAMGNIIRQVQIRSTPDEIAPASQELEQCVKDWITAHGHKLEKVDVWALVTPRERWTGQPLSYFPTVGEAIESGSRLHKVLSGGGGWGNKQGLLALDPEIDFAPPKTALEAVDSDDEDLEVEKQRKFGEVVRPGDVVRFLILRHNDSDSKGTLGKFAQKTAWTNRDSRSVVLGTMESIKDLTPVLSTDPTADDLDPPPFLFVPNHFGMLSEQGVGINISAERRPGSKNLGAEATGTVVQTKVDMPHARLSIHLSQRKGYMPVHVMTEPIQKVNSKNENRPIAPETQDYLGE